MILHKLNNKYSNYFYFLSSLKIGINPSFVSFLFWPLKFNNENSGVTETKAYDF